MLTGKLVHLRCVEPEDAEHLWRWDNDPEVMRWMEDGYPSSLAHTRKRLAEYAENSFERSVFVIDRREDSRPIGIVAIRDATADSGRAEVDLYIGEKDCWNGGYGTEAMRMICRYGFDKMRLHSIQLTVVPENEAAVHVYEKVGFVHEGRQREAFHRDGRWHDLIMMGMLRTDLRD